jgi:tetratricopeptide (TPR) repeat protein
VLLGLLVLIAFLPATQSGFIWDDDAYVTNNPLLVAPDGLWRIWFSLDAPSQYCPLVYSTFRFERMLWGLAPAGYHWTNVLLHAANAILVWRVLRRLGVPGAWFGAAFFGVHPVQVETVAWITERKNVLSAFFYLLALLQWMRFTTSPNEQQAQRPRVLSYFLSLGFYLLALLSKTTACTFPAAMVLTLWVKRAPINRSRWFQVAPFVLLGLAMGLLTMWWERYHQGTLGGGFAITRAERLLIAAHAFWFYLWKLLLPVNLTFSYPRWNISAMDPLAYTWCVALLVLAAAVAVTRRWTGRAIETAFLFYFATLSPLLGLIMLYTFRYSFVADHYQYVACLGPLALLAAGMALAPRAAEKAQLRLPVTVLPLVVVVTLCALTWMQCGMYANAETLWRWTLARNPGSFMAHNNLGVVLLQRGEVEAAIEHFRTGLSLKPDQDTGHYDLGNALVIQGKYDAAQDEFRKAVEINPDYAHAHNHLGNLLMIQGQFQAALSCYEAARRLRPRDADIANNLAWLLATCPEQQVRDGTRAVELAEQAQQLSGGSSPLFGRTLAAAYAETGRFEAATTTARQALELARTQPNRRLAEALELQLELYNSRKPLRSNPTK